MTSVVWPNWLAWLVALAALLTLVLVIVLVGQVAYLRSGMAAGPMQSRRELEDAYQAGRISRDAYERLKGWFS